MRISDWSSDVCSSDLPGFKATLGYAEAFLPAAYRSFGKGDPLVGFPGSKIGRGHLPDQREAERPLSLHGCLILRDSCVRKVATPATDITPEPCTAYAHRAASFVAKIINLEHHVRGPKQCSGG